MNSSDFLKDTPRFISGRFNSVNKFVWETLFPESYRNELLKKKQTKVEKKKEFERLKSISDEASIVVFIFLINRFFIDGSKAAKSAVDTFKDLNIDGFHIGGNFFSERNEKVLQGEKISLVLVSFIEDEKIRELITKSNYITEILNEYKRFI